MTSVTRKTSTAKTWRRSRTNFLSQRTEALAPRWFPIAGIVVVTFVAFLPVLQNDFVNWDDLANVGDNLNYRGLGWRQLTWMFTTFHESLYRPITWLTLGFDYLLWGMAPAGYHLTSLLFHCANAVTFYFIALRILRLVLPAENYSEQALRAGAAFAALIFSLHPLRVEAVAWVSARNDVVSAGFFLLALLSYLHAASTPKLTPRVYRRSLTAAVIFYAASLLAKASGMTLPVALVILDIYPLRRLHGAPWRWFEPPARKILLEKIPFFVLAAVAAVIAFIAKQEFQAVHSLTTYGWSVRISEVFYGLAFYLWKTLLPLNLSPLYQLPAQNQFRAWQFLSSGIAVGVLTIALFVGRKSWPAGAACWGWYVVLLGPFLGLVRFGPQIAADRYSYLSCLSVALLPGAAAVFLWQRQTAGRLKQRSFRLAVALGITALTVLAALSWKQTQVWHDSERLWRHVLAIEPAATYAYHNLAAEMKRRGNSDAAILYYRKAVELDPRFALAHHNLGDIFAERREFDEALSAYRNALQVDPNSVVTYHNLGNMFAQRGRNVEAVQHYLKALEVNPKFARAHNDLGNVLVALGDIDNAAEHFRKSAAFDATATEPLFNLGNLMVRLNQLDRAMAYFQRALDINPEFAQAHNNLGRVLAARGRLDQAVDHFREATRLEPGFVAAHESLIQALIEQGKTEEAWQHSQRTQKLLKPRGTGASFR